MTKTSRRRLDIALVLRLFVQTGARQLLLGTLLAVLTTLAGMALLGVSGWFITATAMAGASTALAFAFNVFAPSAGIRLLALARTAGRYAERLVTHDATFAALAALRERLFRSWAQPQAARRLLRQPARLLFRLTHDIDALESIYLRVWVPAAAALGASLLAGILLALLDLRLGLIIFVWLLCFGFGLALLAARCARVASLRRALGLERLRAQVIDLVAGQTELALAGQLAAQCQKLRRTDCDLARFDDSLHRLETGIGWAYAIAGHVTTFGVLLAAASLVHAGRADGPLAAMALLLVLSALEPFASLRRGALEAGRSWLSARRLAPKMQAAISATTHLAQPAWLVEPGLALQIKAADLYVDAGLTPILHAIELSLTRGERVALVGASGAGKSTLLALVAAELIPRAGCVWARPCTWLTQRTELFQDSLRDNLRLANPAASDAQLWAALHASGLADTVKALAQGLDTPLGEGGLGLSGGQARRLALARLLLHPADVWLLDEPTEGLDGPTAADVLARLAGHAGSNTMLIATHLRREAELANRLLLLKNGRIVAQYWRGTAEYAALLLTMRQH